MVAQNSNKVAFLSGGGELGALIRAHDWAATPLGALDAWPQSLKTATSILLRSPVPMVMLWGEDGVMLYNDAYSAFAGRRHPGLLGSKVREGWPEVADFNDNVMRVGLAGGTLAYRDQELTLYRHGRPEQVWMNLDYSPVLDETGAPAGVLAIVNETSERVAAERRLREGEARFRLMADAAPQIVWITDSQGRVEFFNKQWALYTGAAELPRTAGEVAETYVHPDDVAATLAAFDQARRTGSTYLVEHRIRSAAGAYRWFLVRGEPHRDPATSEVVRWFGASVDIHDRRVAERELRESEARLRLALDAGRLAEVTFHLEDGSVTHAPAFARLFGHPGDKRLTLAEIRAQYHPGDRDRVLAERTAIIESGQDFYEVEKRIVRPDGEIRWLYGRGSVQRDPQGRAVSVTAIYLDETDRKRTEAALRESEARLSFLDRLGAETAPLGDAGAVMATTTRLLGEHLGLSVCAYADMDGDQDGFTIRGDWAAPGAKSIVGHYRLADFGRMAVRNLSAGRPLVLNDNLRELPPEEAATFQSIGIAATICMPLVKDGRLVALMAIHDRVPRVWTEAELNLLREVTARSWAHVERVAAAAELRENEARLRSLNDTLESQVAERTAERDRMWETSPDLMLVVDFEGRIRRVNPAWTTLLGYAPDELVGRHVREFLVPDGDAGTADAHELATGGGRSAVENRYRHKDGSARWIAWVAAPEGGVTYATGRDVTAEKQRQAELEHAQEALRQSQKLESMGQLTGGVAHDFNNLLTPIVGSLDMLQRRKVGGEREQRLIAGAIQSAERAKTLVQRLLAFARRQPLQPTAVDIAGLARGMADLVSSTTGPQVRVVVDAPADLPAATADPNQLEMAILNLAVNARDAMPDGGTLRISASAETVGQAHRSGAKPGRYVRLSVADTGVGMDEATLARAVEPFFSTKGIGKGTGLGLSMVHGLALQLGGALTIQSRVGVGTNIELWLPASTARPEAAGSVADAAPVPEAAGTALLVDDEELVRMSTADMLSDLGYRVVEAASAEEALRLLKGGLRPDLVVTDHLMPGMTGTDLARAVRADRPDIQVLIVSGYAEVEGIAPELPRLAKPFRNADLAATLAGMGIAADG